MSLDILLRIEFFDHPKTLALRRALGNDGVVSLLRLWAWSRRHRPDGDLVGMDVASVEGAAGWTGPRAELVLALLSIAPGESAGFLERADDGETFRLRNWRSTQPWAVAFADAQSVKKSRAKAGRIGGLKAAEARRTRLALDPSSAQPKDGSGRFAPKQPAVAKPQAPPQANVKQGPVGSADVTLCHEQAPPKQTVALRDPGSGEEEESERNAAAKILSPAEADRAASSAPSGPAKPPRPGPAPGPAPRATPPPSSQPSEPNRGIPRPGKPIPVNDSKPNPAWGTDAHGPKSPSSNGRRARDSYIESVQSIERAIDADRCGSPMSDRTRSQIEREIPRLRTLRAEIVAAHPSRILGLPIVPTLPVKASASTTSETNPTRTDRSQP